MRSPEPVTVAGYSPAGIWLLFLLFFFLLSCRSQTLSDSAGVTRQEFTLKVATGHPEKLFHGEAEVSFEVNNFGVTEVAFTGIAGLQMEPTSAYRHRSLSKVSRGDIFFVKCADSSLYECHVPNLWTNQIELEFHPISATDFRKIVSPAKLSEYKKEIHVLVGAVFPLNDFADRSLDDPASGFAATGISAGCEYTQDVASHLQVGVLGMYTHNPIDENTYLAKLNLRDPGTASTISSSGWDLVWLLGEAGAITDIMPIMKLYVRAGAGIMSGVAPDITESNEGTNTVTKSGSTMTFAYGGSIGIIESGRLDLGFRYIHARGEFTKSLQKPAYYLTEIFQFMVGYNVEL